LNDVPARHLVKALRATSEIPALEAIDVGAAGITPLEFFFAEPEYRLYQPVKVRPIENAIGRSSAIFRQRSRRSFRTCINGRPSFFDPTGFIRLFEGQGDRRSIVREARGGAGKSVAGWAAMFECFHAVDRDASNPDRRPSVRVAPSSQADHLGLVLEGKALIVRAPGRETPSLLACPFSRVVLQWRR
jgi:hypothetical protein